MLSSREPHHCGFREGVYPDLFPFLTCESYLILNDLRDDEFGVKKRKLPINEYKDRELEELQGRLTDSGLVADRRPRGFNLFLRLCGGVSDLIIGRKRR
jgi:hypothetical protein